MKVSDKQVMNFQFESEWAILVIFKKLTVHDSLKLLIIFTNRW
jgi:hypothetical protein